MATILFEDIFDVRQLNPDGKKFEKGISLVGNRIDKLFIIFMKRSKSDPLSRDYL